MQSRFKLNEYLSEVAWGMFLFIVLCSAVTELVWKEYHHAVVNIGFIYVAVVLLYRFFFMRRESE